MYIITKDNRPQGNKRYESYDKARQQVRKWIRARHAQAWNYLTQGNNPAINVYGYQIKRV